MKSSDREKRRLKEFEKIRRTKTSTEFDRGYKKAMNKFLKIIEPEMNLLKPIARETNQAGEPTYRSYSAKVKIEILERIKKKVENG